MTYKNVAIGICIFERNVPQNILKLNILKLYKNKNKKQS